MPIDPSIPLSAGQPTNPGIDPQKLITLQMLAQRMHAQQEEQKAQNQLKSIMSQPGAVDESTGMPSPNALKSLWSTSPPIAMEVQKNMLAGQLRQTQTQAMQAKISEAAGQKGQDIRNEANAIYEDVNKRQGPEAAQRAGQQRYDEMLPELRQLMGRDAQIEPNYDYARAKQRAQAWNVAHADPMKVRDEQRKDVELDLKKGKFETRTDHGRTPPVEYRVYPDGRTTNVAGDPYTPSGVGEPKGAEAQLYGGKVGDKDVSVRMGPTGGWINAETGEQVKGVTGIHKVGTKADADADTEGNHETAELIAHYKLAPPSPYRMGTGKWPAIMKDVKSINPDFNAQQYQVAQRVRNSFASGAQDAKQMDAMNTVVHHLGIFDEVANALQNHDVNAINRVVNFVRTELGHPEVTSFDAAKGLIADEVVQSVTGSGAVFDREGMQKLLSSDRSGEQFKNQGEILRRLMAGRMGAKYQRWHAAKLPDDEFVDKLEPETIEGIRAYAPSNLKKALGDGGEPKATGGNAPPQGPPSATSPSGMSVYPTYQPGAQP
jgi:hypothetical protein